jgi:hypothetical protein
MNLIIWILITVFLILIIYNIYLLVKEPIIVEGLSDESDSNIYKNKENIKDLTQNVNEVLQNFNDIQKDINKINGLKKTKDDNMVLTSMNKENIKKNKDGINEMENLINGTLNKSKKDMKEIEE